MKIHNSSILFVLLIVGVCCQDNGTTTILDTTTQAVTDTTTVSTDSTTVADTTTASEDTTTKVVPTTAEAPSSTKSAVTTGSPATTTPVVTTQKTTPKPTVAPTTPVPPTTKPPVAELGSWNVTDGNTTCIRADLKIRFSILVNGSEKYIPVSPKANSTGSCDAFNGTQELQLTESGSYTLTFTFEKNDKDAYVKNVTLNFILPDDTGFVYNDSKLFKVDVGNSYLCSKPKTVPLLNVSMEIFQIHLQAYGSEGNDNFGTAEECDADKVNDSVPIAVGCCLLALVVVVLIAYFVGRRRSRQKGYQSV